ncbi:hypothetical protein OBE_07500, partial [human gut metagenome]
MIAITARRILMLDYLSLDKAQLRQKQRLLQKSYDDFKA